ncbi:MAG: ATP-binding protein [Chloroflexota bacterium]|jgi:K+-sensing histidine kinase KdpD|nr:GAF domain-containing protein [Chloroflexota bacterium]
MISLQQPNLARQWSQQVNLWGQNFVSSVATTQRQVVSMLVQTHLLTDYRVRQRDYLLKITRAISAQLDIDEVLKLVLQSSVEMLTGQAGLVALVEPDGQYRIRAYVGVAKTLLDQLNPIMAESSNWREGMTRMERRLATVVQEIGMGFLEVVGLPLNSGEDILGNLYIMRVRGSGFSSDDREILRSFADQAAIAVHNAQIYARLEHERRRLTVADEMKSTFISAVSHELKTPVALIKGYANTMANPGAKWDESTMRESLKVIEEEADRLTDLIDNLLDASRAQSGAFKLSPVELDIDDLVVRIVKKFQLQTKGHTLIADISKDLPLVYADEARITQVLSNLISNAIKYSPNGGEIRVIGKTSDTEVIIAVADQGKGIAENDQPFVFDRFYRAQDSATQKQSGTGLGLYLAKVFIEAHRGRIWLESDGKSGSTFYFSLPRV